MKKRILIVVGALMALLLVAVLGLMLFGEALFGWLLRPGHDFDPARTPPAPDYALASSWAALPDKEDHADFVPKGESGNRQAEAEADVFFVHPTTYFGTDEWNPPLDDPRAAEMTRVTIADQASVFNHCCRVYAPEYRQAAMGSYMGFSDNSAAAFAIAYADVAAAFAYYLEHYNAGRPFILAAHSQGTMHALRLLEQIVASPAAERLVAAYMVGYRPGTKMLAERLPSVPPCAGPTETGCLVAWDTHSQEGDPDFDLPVYHWYGDELRPTEGVPRLCTNPISWRTDAETVPAERHLGIASIDTKEPFPNLLALMFSGGPLGIEVIGITEPQPKQISARCSGGRLLIPPMPEPYQPMDAAGSYHLFDYDFFYLDVRQNAVDRVNAYLAAHATEEAAAEPGAAQPD